MLSILKYKKYKYRAFVSMDYLMFDGGLDRLDKLDKNYIEYSIK